MTSTPECCTTTLQPPPPKLTKEFLVVCDAAPSGEVVGLTDAIQQRLGGLVALLWIQSFCPQLLKSSSPTLTPTATRSRSIARDLRASPPPPHLLIRLQLRLPVSQHPVAPGDDDDAAAWSAHARQLVDEATGVDGGGNCAHAYVWVCGLGVWVGLGESCVVCVCVCVCVCVWCVCVCVCEGIRGVLNASLAAFSDTIPHPTQIPRPAQPIPAQPPQSTHTTPHSRFIGHVLPALHRPHQIKRAIGKRLLQRVRHLKLALLPQPGLLADGVRARGLHGA